MRNIMGVTLLANHHVCITDERTMPRLFAIAAAIALIVCGIAGAVAVIVTQRTQQTQRMAMVEAAADDIFLEQVYWRAVSDGKDPMTAVAAVKGLMAHLRETLQLREAYEAAARAE